MTVPIRSGVKCKIRGDRDAGVIRAWIATDDESVEQLIGTLDMAMAEDDRQLFKEWKDAMSAFVTRWVERTAGVKVATVQEFRKCDEN